MGKFLKNFGMGLVYVFLLPILLFVLALAGVYLLGYWFYQAGVFLVRFFKGYPGFEELEEDKRVREILEARREANRPKKPEEESQEKPAPAPQPQNVYVQQNFYQMPPGYMPPPGFTPIGQPQINPQNPLPIPEIPQAPTQDQAAPLPAEGQREASPSEPVAPIEESKEGVAGSDEIGVDEDE